jgi:hypothetical protein
MSDPSPALRAANERLLALRAQLDRQTSAGLQADQPQPDQQRLPSLPHSQPDQTEASEETAVVNTPPTNRYALPAHLGWHSPAVTTALRSRQAEPKTAVSSEIPDGPPAQTLSAQPTTTNCSLSDVNFSPLPASFRIHPSLALALLRGQQVAAGRLWLLLRLLDSKGRGWLNRADIEAAFSDPDSPTHFCTPRYLRQLLAAGDGFFWEREGSEACSEHVTRTCLEHLDKLGTGPAERTCLEPAERKVWLRSQAKVAAALGVTKLRGPAVELPLSVLLGPIGDLRAHLYASFHSGRGDEANPISRASLRDLSGVSPRTQQAYDARAEVDIQPCLAIGGLTSVTSSQENAWQQGRAAFTFTDYQGQQGAANGRYQAHRLPNRYSGPHPQVGGRPKRLNRQLADLCHKGYAGNDQPDQSRRYYADGAAAGRVWLRQQGRVLVYWQAGGDLANGRQPRTCFWYMLGTGAV